MRSERARASIARARQNSALLGGAYSEQCLTRSAEHASPCGECLVKMPSVSLCFPAYNEEASIGPVVEEAHRLATEAGLDFEIIVCDDGSIDRTADEVDRLADSLPG